MTKRARVTMTIPVPVEASNSARMPSFPWLAGNRTGLTRKHPGLAANSRAAVRDSPERPAERSTEGLHIAAAGFRTAVNGQLNPRAGMNIQGRDGDPRQEFADFSRKHPMFEKAGQRRLVKTDGKRMNPASEDGLNPNSSGAARMHPAVRCARDRTETAIEPWHNPRRGVGRNRGWVGAGAARLKPQFDDREPDDPWLRPGTGVAPRSDQPMMSDVTGVVEAAEAAPRHPGAMAARNGCSDPRNETDGPEAEGGGRRGAMAGDDGRNRKRG